MRKFLFGEVKRAAGRPVGTIRRESGSATSVWINDSTRKWCEENRFSFNHVINHAPTWQERMYALTAECSELREGMEKKNALIQKLHAENADLLRFKDKVRQSMEQGVRYG